ncbi:MAG: hypothetical protein V4792_18395 [Pseudomonadota bacterium]
MLIVRCGRTDCLTSRVWSVQGCGIWVKAIHACERRSAREAAAAIGAAIGRPGLEYVQSSAAQAKSALRALGFSADAADPLEALSRWLSTSSLASAGVAPVAAQPTTSEAFARERFAPVFARMAAEAA